MRFGPVPIAGAEGAVLAHSLMLSGRKLPKGRVLGPDEVAALAAAGIETVVVARLDPGDVGEDTAAARLAAALVPDPGAAGLRLTEPHSGRVNLNATVPGIVEIDAARIHALNRIDQALTFATLAPFERVAPGQLVGTVKVIPYAVAGPVLEAATRVATGAIRVRPVRLRSAGLILTVAEDGAVADKLVRKGQEAVAGRLRALGMELVEAVTVPHEVGAMAAALRGLRGDMALILTAAATSDLHDTAPEAVRAAGGHVERFGMPVDPGNLLFHGTLGDRPVIGLPGCSRSPALNGADWVLERLACGIDLTSDDISAMGVGGLLKEIPIRPAPRERRPAIGE
ncbi:MAG: molybdopterin biosynthesis protein [Rhodobacterales bacterium 32-67-9]|nr:MAG: molybdopterin biosynthesis protein [Rhodobacterales bacterium 32-67-9]